MAIVKMSKFNLLAFNYDRGNLLKELQDFEFVHFNDLSKSDEEKFESLEQVIVDNEVNAVNEELTKVNWSIDLLSKYKEKDGMIKSLKEGVATYSFEEIKEKGSKFDFKSIYKNLLRASDIIENNKQEIHNNKLKIDELKVWSSINIPIAELYGFKKVFVTTGVVPTRYMENLRNDYKDIDNAVIEVVSEDKGNVYIVFISNLEEKNRDLEILRKNGFNSIRINTSGIVKDDISKLQKDLENSNKTILQQEDIIKDNVKFLEDIEVYYEFLTNVRLRETSVENFVKTDRVNVIEGYVPKNLEEEFKTRVNKILENRYYLELEEADKDDPNVPIILENGKFAEAFEGMTEMYSLPRYNEIDPTPLFAPFYAIFAGMMVGDLGYGLLLTIGCIIGLKFFNLKESMRKFVKFFMFIGICTCIAGIVYGSFFGFSMIEDPILSPSNDSMKMIMVSLVLGGIHLFFGLAIQAYMKIRDKKIMDAIFDVGFWYMTLIGIIVFAISKLIPGISPVVGKVFIIISVIGMVGIVATGGRDAETIVGKVASGVYELYGITSYIGDFVSYLRIMALALSGGFIALAVNMIVEMLFGAGILGAIGGLIVFVIFQLFNVFLSYLSAYVHTARLTYVEMFNKFYEGGGKAFKGLVEKSKYFNIKRENN
ncbi:V-type ATP synthase subunit I [Miniphocaeibacter halophilus]|uniref:V-type ATP synthase subunit I n=1 Tax=Miniphocaeibacter halophilus TaxID=2931922 RepID=A0AC61MT60_9FIRM|nr:V-type ATP synthase subunit I [Miniphocaeibacter halophilus]QQK07421.1 V-type ATP synthase subunit I [Miniphocaeibacter halophilus]